MNTAIEVVCNFVVTLPVFYSKTSNTYVLREIEKADWVLLKYVDAYKKDKFSHIYFICINLLYFALVVNDTSYYFRTDIWNAEFIYYTFDHFYRYRLSIAVFYIHSLIKELLRRAKLINGILSEAFGRESLDLSDAKVVNDLENVVKDASECYTSVIHVIGRYNGMFGWQLLAIFLNYIFLFMVAYECGLRIVDGPFNRQFSIWFACCIIYAAVGSVLITSICDRTSSEARKTADLTYFYYYKLNISDYNVGEETLARSMLSLIRQTRSLTSAERDHFENYIFDQVYRYRISITVFYIYSLIKEILARAKSINEILINSFEEISSLDKQKSNNLKDLENTINDLSEAYQNTAELISHMNNLFGWQILGIFFNYIFLFMTTYESGLNIINPITEYVDVLFYFWVFCSITYAGVGSVVITSICDRTSREVRKTADLTYSYYYKLNISEYKVPYSLIKELQRMLKLMNDILINAFQTIPSLDKQHSNYPKALENTSKDISDMLVKGCNFRLNKSTT
ncbi:hypothetical protein Trydic_g8573 [Trypoxylus dichotomus]